MLEVLAGLPTGARVLDLGAGAGSFEADGSRLSLVRLDLEVPAARKSGAYVAADAARMPFADASFDAVISNHSLEHFERFEETLAEIGRVIKSDGALYIAVPDADTWTDRIYRWLGRGGGHVNAFRRPADISEPVERLTGLRLRAVRELYSSFSFLNRHNFVARPPRRIALFGFGSERFLAIAVWLVREVDRRRGSRLSRYGWSFWFGKAEIADSAPWVNVCVRCGAGHSVAFLRKRQAVERWFGRQEQYRCPECGGWNLLSPELCFQTLIKPKH